METNRQSNILLQIGNHMWKWNKNLEYIKLNKELINEKIYATISNEKYYSPEFRDSLHDSRLAKAEIHNGEIEDFISKKDIDKNITIMLVGAYYDRYHIIRYKKVKNYSLSGGLEDSDLIEHYFSIGGDFLVHTMNFQFGSISILFEDIEIETMEI